MSPDTRRKALIALGAAVALGSLMPWVSVATGFGGQSVAGTDGDGKWTLLAGGVAAVLAFINRHAWHVKAAFVVSAGLAILAAIGTRANIDDYHDEFGDVARATIGWGLWLTVASAVAGCVLSFIRTEDETKLPHLPPPGSDYYRGTAS